MARSEERCSSSQSYRKPGRFHPYASSDKSLLQQNRKSSVPAWKQIRERQQSSKGRGKASTFSQKQCATGLKDCVCVPGQLDLNPSPVVAKDNFMTSKSETIFICKLLCCKCSFCHRVATKERRKSQLLSKLHRNKICERCFLCRSLEFCKSCHKCPNCCYNSTCRVKVTVVLGEVGSSGFESKGSHNTERGLHPPLPVQTKSNQVTNCHKQLCQSTETVQPFGGTVSTDEQKCSGTGSKAKLTGFLQPAIFGTQTQQLVETYPGPEHLEHLPKHRVFQNGDPRDNKNLRTARGVGYLHRLQGCILQYTNSQSVQEVHAFSHPGSVLPVQSPTLWPVHSTYGVHSGGQRGQTDGFTERYKNPPVPRRLVGESHIPPNLSPTYTDLGSSLSRTRLAGEQGEVRTGPKTGFQLRRLPVRSHGGQGQTHTRALADLTRQDTVNPVQSGVLGPAVHVPHRTSNSHRKASPSRSTSYETHTVALEEQLEGTRITRKGDTHSHVPRSLHPHLRWWLEEKNVLPGQPLHPLKHALQIFTDTSKEGWGAHLNERTARGTWSLPESKLHINHLELKVVFLALKKFKDLCSNNIVLVATDNTTVVAYINKEGGMKSGSLCALLWRILSWCTRKQETLKACHIPGRLNVIADKLSRPFKQNGPFTQECFKLYAPCLPPDSTTNSHSLCHQSQTPRLGQWMHSACLGKIWTHMPSHQQPSWAKWWRSYRTTPATVSF